MSYKRLRNNTSRHQSVVYKGDQIVLSPNEERLFEEPLAAVIQEKLGPIVSDVSVASTYVDPTKTSNTLWIANMTGNPDSPPMVKKKVWRNKVWEMVDVENPLHTAEEFHFEQKGSQIEVQDKSGLGARTMFPTNYRIPSFTRTEVPMHVGRTILRRDGNSEPECRGRVRKSRAPTAFEPDMSWDYDDMRLYMKLLDPSAGTGASQGQLEAGAKRSKKKDPAFAMFEAKEKLMKRLFFRLVDPSFRLPTRDEFNEMKGLSQGNPEVPVEDLVEDVLHESSL